MNGEVDQRDEVIDPQAARDTFEQSLDTAKTLYSDPHFIWKGRLVESDFKLYVERELNPNVVSSTTMFSKGTKLALLRIVNAFFDKNTPLSNIDSLDRCMLNLKLALTLAILAMKESDRNNPQLKVAQNAIENAYYHLITRAKGGEERKLQNKLEQSLETTQKVIHANAPQRRGLGIFGGNGR